MKLSDTQLVILNAAAGRENESILPLPASLRGGAQNKVVDSLMKKGLIEEVEARNGDQVWRETGDGHGVTLTITKAGLAAIGIEEEDETMDDNKHETQGFAPEGPTEPQVVEYHINDGTNSDGEPAAGATDAPQDAPKAKAKGKGRAAKKGAQAAPKAKGKAKAAPKAKEPKAAPTPRTGTKQEKLISMLRAKDGASIDEIAAETGWQKHTVRGAIAGALKKKLGLAVASERVEGRGTVYKLPAEA